MGPPVFLSSEGFIFISDPTPDATDELKALLEYAGVPYTFTTIGRTRDANGEILEEDVIYTIAAIGGQDTTYMIIEPFSKHNNSIKFGERSELYQSRIEKVRFLRNQTMTPDSTKMVV